jgi:hypothetical protein
VPNVILPEPPKKEAVDMSTAETYGQLVTVFETAPGGRRVAGTPTTFDPDKYARILLEKLDAVRYDPDLDFILLVGGSLAVGITMAAVSARYGRMRLLVYNSSMGRYVDKWFEVGDTTNGDTRWRGTVTSSLSPARSTAAR